MKTIAAALLIPAAVAAGADLIEQPMLGTVLVGYTQSVSGRMEVDGKSYTLDSAERVDLQFRSYYFADRANHPFTEFSLQFSHQRVADNGVDATAKSIVIGLAAGSTIPLWQAATSDTRIGIAPWIGVSFGRIDLFVDRTDSAGTLSGSGDGNRLGLGGGVDAYCAINHGFVIALGALFDYWNGGNIGVDFTPVGGGPTTSTSAKFTGTDLGVRLMVGFAF